MPNKAQQCSYPNCTYNAKMRDVFNWSDGFCASHFREKLTDIKQRQKQLNMAKERETLLAQQSPLMQLIYNNELSFSEKLTRLDALTTNDL